MSLAPLEEGTGSPRVRPCPRPSTSRAAGSTTLPGPEVGMGTPDVHPPRPLERGVAAAGVRSTDRWSASLPQADRRRFKPARTRFALGGIVIGMSTFATATLARISPLVCAAASAGCSSSKDAACTDSATASRYHACVATTDELACTSAGGSWVAAVWLDHADAGVQYVCSCPTGQSGCPCASSADCLSGCADSAKQVLPSDSCADAELRCLPNNLPLGECACRYWYAGKIEPVCLD